jgi:NIMA-interacting peptidyl-prolyl cis-trans isomerase 4
MGKGKAAEKGNEKGGAAAKGGKGAKGAKGKGDSSEEKAGKVKGAQQINVRHILVRFSLSTWD